MEDIKLTLRDTRNLQLDIPGAVRLRVVPYGTNIGIIEVDDNGHTVRQVAYYDAESKTWRESDGSGNFHCSSPVKRPPVELNPVLVGHTSNPEFEKLKMDPVMEALRDRTVRIDIPYLNGKPFREQQGSVGE